MAPYASPSTERVAKTLGTETARGETSPMDPGRNSLIFTLPSFTSKHTRTSAHVAMQVVCARLAVASAPRYARAAAHPVDRARRRPARTPRTSRPDTAMLEMGN